VATFSFRQVDNKDNIITIMATDKQTIINDIKNHINKNGGSYSDWYVGIAKNPRDRLFQDHNVRQSGEAWIFRQAESETIARQIEDYFVNTLGTDGGTGGGVSPDHVYAYKKTSHSNP